MSQHSFHTFRPEGLVFQSFIAASSEFELAQENKSDSCVVKQF